MKRLFCNFYEINCAKTILLKSIFCNNFGRDGSGGKGYKMRGRRSLLFKACKEVYYPRLVRLRALLVRATPKLHSDNKI